MTKQNQTRLQNISMSGDNKTDGATQDMIRKENSKKVFTLKMRGILNLLFPAILLAAPPLLADDASLTGTYSGVVACERTENGLPGVFSLNLDIRVHQNGDRLDIATWTAEDEALQRKTASLYTGKAAVAVGQVSGYVTACRPDFDYIETIRIVPSVAASADFSFAADTVFVTEALPGREGNLIVESCRWVMTRTSAEVPEMETCSGN